MSKAPNVKTGNPRCRAKRNCSNQWTHSHCEDCDEPCAVGRSHCVECEWELRDSD